MTTFGQLTVSGIALGCLYALVSLGFVVVMKATGVFNLLQGGFVLLGAYLTYNAHQTWGLAFGPAVLVAMALCAGIGMASERVFFRPVLAAGQAGLGAAVLVGIGLLSVSEALSASVWGADAVSLGDPFGLRVVRVAGMAVTVRDLWVMGLSAAGLLAFWYLFQRTRLGVAMRACAADREAALAQGIDPGQVAALAWSIAAVVGVLAGVMLGSEVGGGLSPTLSQVAFAALPALILGGVDSVAGAVAGGIVLGLVRQYVYGYAPASLGQGFSEVLPYLIMIVILVVKPDGLFGTARIRRA